MKDVFSLIQAVVPQVNEELSLRLKVMAFLANSSQRLGRKSLAEGVEVSERSLRTVLTSLRQQGLVEVSRDGAKLTTLGKQVFEALGASFGDAYRFYEMEEQLKKVLQVERCYIVSGNADKDARVYDALGEVVQRLLQRQLSEGRNTIAVTGGSTLSKIGNSFSPVLAENRQLLFVPARGGIGGTYDIQSSSVVELMARQTNSDAISLFVPENANAQLTEMLLEEPNVKQIVETTKKADCLILSVGVAEVMAERYKVTEEQLRALRASNAIGEAFGIFFDQEGREVMRLPRYGVQPEDLERIPHLVTVVAGESKAQAMIAHYKLVPKHGCLICDEGIAKKVLSGINTR